MNILVTGGAGFIGSNLCRALVGQGHCVTCLDNLSTGDMSNLEGLEGSRFMFVNGDVTDCQRWAIGVFDRVYNLACPASPVAYQKDPVKTIQASVVGLNNLLDMATRSGTRILQASTSEVYGDPQEHPQTEAYWGHVNPIGPRACYDEGKRCGEALAMSYHAEHGTDIRIARLFNTYGPGMAADDGRVVSNFIVQALKCEPIVIHGNGEQTRSFCYVSDMVKGLVALMEYAGPDAHEPVNLGNPYELSIAELAALVRDVAGKGKPEPRFVFRGRPKDDPQKRKPDISRAMLRLNWNPEVGIVTGLTETVRWFHAKEI